MPKSTKSLKRSITKVDKEYQKLTALRKLTLKQLATLSRKRPRYLKRLSSRSSLTDEEKMLTEKGASVANFTPKERRLYLNLRKRLGVKPYSKRWRTARTYKVLKLAKRMMLKESAPDHWPVIGILSIPVHTYMKNHTNSYIPQSYVKWIEMSGARVVPLQYNLPRVVLRYVLSQIHGILLPGGTVERAVAKKEYSAFMSTVQFICDYVKVQNYRGNYYPIFGICLGFQILGIQQSCQGNMLKCGHQLAQDFLHNRDISKAVEHGPAPLEFLKKKGKVYANQPFLDTANTLRNIFTPSERDFFKKNPVVFYHHELGFVAKKPYMKKMNYLSVSAWRTYKGTKYIAAYEYKTLPWYGVQFHPEKVIYEWLDLGIPHSEMAIRLSQGLSNFLVNEARKNQNVWIGGISGGALLIYNYNLFSRGVIMGLLFPKKKTKANYSQIEESYYFGDVDTKWLSCSGWDTTGPTNSSAGDSSSIAATASRALPE